MISIPVRLGSSRLAKKHIQSISPSMTCLELLISRLKNTKTYLNGSRIVLNTTFLEEDRIFGEIAKTHGIEVFFGDVENIPLRLYQAMEHFKPDFVVNVDGDDLLCPWESIDSVVQSLSQCVRACETTAYPLGLNSFGFKSEYLRQMLDSIIDNGRETGWKPLFGSHMEIVPVEVSKIEGSISKKLRFTLDYPEDLLFFRAIHEVMGSSLVQASVSDIVSEVIQNKIYELNMCRIDEYWQNFHGSK